MRKALVTLNALVLALWANLTTAEFPRELPDYKSQGWHLYEKRIDKKTHKVVAITYRTNEEPPRAIRVFPAIAVYPTKDLKFEIIGYSLVTNPNPKRNPIEIHINIKDKEYKNNTALLDVMYANAVQQCGECHEIAEK